MWLRRELCAVFLVGFLIIHGEQNSEDSRIVQTTQGPVKGYRALEGDLFVYYSIPYATAPTGKDRFKAPLPGPVWTEPLEAVNKGIICHQGKENNDAIQNLDNFLMQENCLIANVYTPDTNKKDLPVVVIFHGGGFQSWYGDATTPKHLVRSKKIVAVTFNYRLGAHGFLCLGTSSAPGNAGMKDQVAVLRWVNKNIANFGGNPNDVTIEGHSAGSASVDILLLSRAAKGLFHKAIPESGASVAPWVIQLDPIANAKNYVDRYAKEYADKNQYIDLNNIKVLEEFYLSAPYEVLYQANVMSRKENDFIFTPCIEKDVGEEMILHDNPYTILKNNEYNKVPMLYGFTKDEGLLRVQFAYDIFKDGMNEKFSNFIPQDLQFKSEEEKEKVSSDIKEFYFGNYSVGESVQDFIDYYTDVMFSCPTLRAVTLQVEAGNDKIFLYEYSFPEEPLFKVPGVEKYVGSNHAAQTLAVLDSDSSSPGLNEANLPEDVKKIKRIMREFWLNFITTGSPVPPGSALPQWPPAGSDRSPYMELSLNPELHGELLPRRARFWDAIYEKHYRAPQPPSSGHTNFVVSPIIMVVSTLLLIGNF